MSKIAGERSKPSVSHQDTRKVCYQVGSHFHPCVCGSVQVFRSHQPGDTGWTHYCWACSRKDGATGFATPKRKVPFLVLKMDAKPPIASIRRLS